MKITDEQTRKELLLEAEREGYRAYCDGFDLDDNPYNNNDEWDFHIRWKEGYNDAAWDD